MKRILMLSVLVGLAVVMFLGGAVIYQINKIKKQTQVVLNQSFKSYSHRLERKNINFYFSPFECEGLFRIQCKSSKAVILRENALLFSLSELFLSLRDFDSQSFNIDFRFGLDDMQISQDLEDYSEILMPKNIRGSIKLTFQPKIGILAETNVEFLAKKLDYKIQFDSRFVSDKLRDRGIFKDSLENLFNDPIKFIKMDLQLLAKGLSPALFEVIKKQYGEKISFQDYQGLLAFMVALGRDQFSYSSTMQKIINDVGELALGDKQQLHLYFVGQEEICLNCQPFTIEGLKSIIDQSRVEILVQ